MVLSEVVARRFTLAASGLAVYGGLVTVAAVVLGDEFFGFASLIDVGIYWGLAYGVYKRNRTCSIILFAYNVLSRVVIYRLTGEFSSVFNVATLTYAVIFLLGILGTFAHHAIVAERRQHAKAV